MILIIINIIRSSICVFNDNKSIDQFVKEDLDVGDVVFSAWDHYLSKDSSWSKYFVNNVINSITLGPATHCGIIIEHNNHKFIMTSHSSYKFDHHSGSIKNGIMLLPLEYLDYYIGKVWVYKRTTNKINNYDVSGIFKDGSWEQNIQNGFLHLIFGCKTYQISVCSELTKQVMDKMGLSFGNIKANMYTPSIMEQMIKQNPNYDPQPILIRNHYYHAIRSKNPDQYQQVKSVYGPIIIPK